MIKMIGSEVEKSKETTIMDIPIGETGIVTDDIYNGEVVFRVRDGLAVSLNAREKIVWDTAATNKTKVRLIDVEMRVIEKP